MPQGKLTRHSLTRFQRAKNGTFCRFLDFPMFCFPAIFFFPGKVYPPLTHSISEGGKKKGVEKKNSIFTHSPEKPRKGANFKLLRGKKYGTFGCIKSPEPLLQVQ